jgi:molybdopterin molybdotransferase
MISFEDALNMVLGQANFLGSERVPLAESPGRFLAEDIFSDIDMPPFDKSAVDGYACRLDDIPPSVGTQESVPLLEIFRVIETIPAGKIPQKTIGPLECAKIMTGAMVPDGADCVVMIEDAERAGENLVSFTRGQSSKNICYRSEDIRAGDLVLEKGLQIKPAHVAAMAGVGATTPLVAKLPRVAIIATGDELVEPWATPEKAQIRNSNGWQLEAQVKAVPAIPSCLGIVTDDVPALRNIIDLSTINNDVVLLTGGVSMGEFDYVPEIMQAAGIEILFEKIAIQPGKPTVFGRKGDTFFFGLPGNPVSSFVLFEMIVKPFLGRMMGSREEPLELILPMGVDFSRRKSERKSMIPVTLKNGTVFPLEYHGSAHINAYSKANAILVLEIGTTAVGRGDLVHVRPI